VLISPIILSLLSPVSAVDLPVLVGGIHINEPDLNHYAQAVSDVGLNAVQVTVYARQGVYDSTDLTFDPEEDESGVLLQIRTAHDAGLQVVLVLRTYLEHGLPENRHMWHGMIWPNDDALSEWFSNYQEFTDWGASLAQAEGVEALIIGNELNSMTSTVHVDELPELYQYLLDEERTEAVREDLVGAANSLTGDELIHLDGHTFDGLGEQLMESEIVQRDWVREHVVEAGGSQALSDRRDRLDDHWRRLISETRALYEGPIMYGANFDQFEQVGFWDALDGIAVSAYFPLSLWNPDLYSAREDTPAMWGKAPILDSKLRADRFEQMVEGWSAAAESMSVVSQSAGGLPVYLIELGWTRQAGSTVRPWSYGRVDVLETVGVVGEGEAQPLTPVSWLTQRIDLTERIDAMRALSLVVESGGLPSLRGINIWKVTTRDYHWEIEPFAVLLPTSGPDTRSIPEDRALLREAVFLGQLLSR
jgi:hypothetical protein